MAPSLPAMPEQELNWVAACLEAHNCRRARHGAPPLVWSASCAEEAWKAAAECERTKSLKHCHLEGYGQNGFWRASGPLVPTAEDVVESWYRELRLFDFGREGPQGGTGHFTQLVWLASSHVGMVQKGEYIFANYWPGGNVRGDFRKNVFPEGTPMKERKATKAEPVCRDRSLSAI